MLEVMVRKDLLQVADRNSGPLTPPCPTARDGYDYDGLTEYLKRVKAKFPEKTEATHPAGAGHSLRHPGAGHGPGARVRDRRGPQHRAGGAVPGHLHRRCPRHRCAAAGARRRPRPAKWRHHEHVQPRPAHGAASPAQPGGCAAESDSADRHPLGDGGVSAGVLDRGRGHPEHQGHRDSAVDRADGAEAVRRRDGHQERPVRAGRAHRQHRRHPRRAGRPGRAAARRAQAPAAGRARR